MYVEAEHFCTQARGMREVSSPMGTLVSHGAYNMSTHMSEESRLLIEDHRAFPSAA